MRVVRPQRRSPGSGDADRGAVAVEFALVLPILVLLVFGIVDFGRLLHAQIVVTDAAREAARAAALVDDDAAIDRGTEATASLGATAATPVTVTVDESCPDDPDPAADTHVTVTYHFPFVTPVLLALGFGDDDGHVDISSTSVMPCLR